MTSYVVFLRGINVGGKSLIKMDALREALADCGLENVKTYIASGNVLFESNTVDKKKLGKQISDCIKQTFKLEVLVAVFSHKEWQEIIKSAPKWWGKDSDWKHNILILIRPADIKTITADIGELKPGIEQLEAGNGVLYQSIAWNAVGKGVTGSKLVANAAYKYITIRNYNTANKLVDLF